VESGYVPRIRLTTRLLLAFGLGLHSYTAISLAAGFNVFFWLWSLSPYFIGACLHWKWRRDCATSGAVMLPAAADATMHYLVFHMPQGSTAALGLLAMPLWNLTVLMPVGGCLGWLIDRRRLRLLEPR
jgi:hypothetical protein